MKAKKVQFFTGAYSMILALMAVVALGAMSAAAQDADRDQREEDDDVQAREDYFYKQRA